ncbi:MAG: GGDEF domain-containing protein [Gammaproteobacteria bacterium]|nr:MAG: GGDEF domain-containing protein [Gammaproteobacteria bacterium]
MKTVSNEKNEDNLLCARGDNSCDFLTEIVELRREVNVLTELVRTDALTGLFNFRFFNETITLEMERTRRGTQPLSMILLDIDHFKKFNDKWGHEIGNHALVHISNLIKVAVRKLDFACRFGGEEFVILLPNTDLRQAISVADRLREMIATVPLEVADEQPISITASLGVDEFTSRNSETSELFIRRVDEWLYKAKNNGRNQVAHPNPRVVVQQDSVTQEEKSALFGAVGNSTQDEDRL